MNKYLKKVPTFLVIGMSGFAAWPILFPEENSSPPAPAIKRPTKVMAAIPEHGPLVRNPFKFPSSPTSPATPVPPPAPTARLASERPKETGRLALPTEDGAVLGKLRLTGTHIEGPRQLAVIDGMVYAQGESLKDRDGSPMAYAVEAIHADRVVLRREKRNFVLEFPERPKVAEAKPGAPTPMSKAESRRGESPTRRESPTATRGPARNPTSGSGDDQKDSVVKLLTGLMGQVPGAGSPGGTDSGLPSGLGGSDSLPAGVTPAGLSAGIDALMGKLDNIGRTGAGGSGR